MISERILLTNKNLDSAQRSHEDFLFVHVVVRWYRCSEAKLASSQKIIESNEIQVYWIVWKLSNMMSLVLLPGPSYSFFETFINETAGSCSLLSVYLPVSLSVYLSSIYACFSIFPMLGPFNLITYIVVM